MILAGTKIARVATQLCKRKMAKPVFFWIGPGNKVGDAYVLAFSFCRRDFLCEL